jgi:hypothetical protein
MGSLLVGKARWAIRGIRFSCAAGYTNLRWPTRAIVRRGREAALLRLLQAVAGIDRASDAKGRMAAHRSALQHDRLHLDRFSLRQRDNLRHSESRPELCRADLDLSLKLGLSFSLASEKRYCEIFVAVAFQ